jgi:hypothetical protein
MGDIYEEGQFIDAYIECAFWSSVHYPDPGEDSEPVELDSLYSFEDLSREAYVKMRDDCSDFMGENNADLDFVTERMDDYDYGSAGHDFWLTRNGHGAGFWDRYYGGDRELSLAFDRLSANAKAHGECLLDAIGNKIEVM